ncbi:hypothetical protein Hanom_Chr10g00922991 [Helianthus anomalus]
MANQKIWKKEKHIERFPKSMFDVHILSCFNQNADYYYNILFCIQNLFFNKI